jgi:hypothetical protein
MGKERLWLESCLRLYYSYYSSHRRSLDSGGAAAKSSKVMTFGGVIPKGPNLESKINVSYFSF